MHEVWNLVEGGAEHYRSKGLTKRAIENTNGGHRRRRPSEADGLTRRRRLIIPSHVKTKDYQFFCLDLITPSNMELITILPNQMDG